jgi:hypothetical protein
VVKTVTVTPAAAPATKTSPSSRANVEILHPSTLPQGFLTMSRLHVSPLPPRTKEQIAAQIRAQFRYARFSSQDYSRDWAFHRAVD